MEHKNCTCFPSGPGGPLSPMSPITPWENTHTQKTLDLNNRNVSFCRNHPYISDYIVPRSPLRFPRNGLFPKKRPIRIPPLTLTALMCRVSCYGTGLPKQKQGEKSIQDKKSHFVLCVCVCREMRSHTDQRLKVCFSDPRDPLNIFHPSFIQSGEAVIRRLDLPLRRWESCPLGSIAPVSHLHVLRLFLRGQKTVLSLLGDTL